MKMKVAAKIDAADAQIETENRLTINEWGKGKLRAYLRMRMNLELIANWSFSSEWIWN